MDSRFRGYEPAFELGKVRGASNIDGCQTPSAAADESEVSAESGRGPWRGLLDVACIVRHFRSCLECNRCGGNDSLFEGGELGVSHVGQPSRNCLSHNVYPILRRWM